jgi:pyrimidine-nucleoside phosphorylase
MLVLAGKDGLSECEGLTRDALFSGRAFLKFNEMVKAQGGDERYIQDTGLFGEAAVLHEVLAAEDGYIVRMDAEGCGTAAMITGAGRDKADGTVDYAAGIVLTAKTGDFVRKGDVLAVLHTNRAETVEEAKKAFLGSVYICGVGAEVGGRKDLILREIE